MYKGSSFLIREWLIETERQTDKIDKETSLCAKGK